MPLAIDDRYRKYEDKSTDDTYDGPDDGWVDYLHKNAQHVRKYVMQVENLLLMPQVISSINWQVENGYSENVDIKFLTNATVFRSKWIDLFPNLKE